GRRAARRLARRRALHQHDGHQVAHLVRALPEVKRSVSGGGAEDRPVRRSGCGRWWRRERSGKADRLGAAACCEREWEGGAERCLADHRVPHRVWLALRSMSSTAEIIFELIS